jgi:hypothetical protein
VDLDSVMHQTCVTALELDSLAKIVLLLSANLVAPTAVLASAPTLAAALQAGKANSATSLSAMPLPAVELVIA